MERHTVQFNSPTLLLHVSFKLSQGKVKKFPPQNKGPRQICWISWKNVTMTFEYTCGKEKIHIYTSGHIVLVWQLNINI